MFILMPVSSAAKVGAYNVIVDGDYVSAAARCSCGVGSYSHRTGTFKNYCPGCHHSGTLRFEQGPYYGYNSGTSPEGLFYCTVCDRDYCCQCGKIHDSSGLYLIRAQKPKPEAVKPAVPSDPVVASKNLFGTVYSFKQSHINHVKASI